LLGATSSKQILHMSAAESIVVAVVEDDSAADEVVSEMSVEERTEESGMLVWSD